MSEPDVGDVRFISICALVEAVKDIETFYRRIYQASVTPLSAGGSHSISYPTFKAIAAEDPLGMIHIDDHTHTWDGLFGSKLFHGAPFSRAVEDELLDPKRTVQIGIRGAQSATESWDYSLEKGILVIFIDEFEKL